MRETITELIVGLAISLAIVALAIGVIETGIDRYVDGARTTSPPQVPGLQQGDVARATLSPAAGRNRTLHRWPYLGCPPAGRGLLLIGHRRP